MQAMRRGVVNFTVCQVLVDELATCLNLGLHMPGQSFGESKKDCIRRQDKARQGKARHGRTTDGWWKSGTGSCRCSTPAAAQSAGETGTDNPIHDLKRQGGERSHHRLPTDPPQQRLARIATQLRHVCGLAMIAHLSSSKSLLSVSTATILPHPRGVSSVPVSIAR